MRKGFHWYSPVEWVFILFLVMLLFSVAANGATDLGFLTAITETFFAVLNGLALVFGTIGLLSLFLGELGLLALLVLFLVGILFFRVRVVELLVTAVFLLFLVTLVF